MLLPEIRPERSAAQFTFAMEVQYMVCLPPFSCLCCRRIVLAEPVPDPDHGNKPSRKYLSLVVDLGNEKRRVVSAVRSIVDVEDAIG